MKFFSYAIIVVLYLCTGFLTGVLNAFYKGNSDVVSIVMLCGIIISYIIFALSAFALSEKIYPSKNGLRYKVASILTVFIGFSLGVKTLKSVYNDAELTDVFSNPEILRAFLLSLLNNAFVFGVSLFIIYKTKFSKNRNDYLK